MTASDTDETRSRSDSETIPLDEDGEVRLPIVDVLTGRAFITGKSGSGKSNTASVVVEELLERGFPVLIVDTDGEYWGLKEEYEILHVGADEECDLQVGPEHSEKLAELALEQNVPIILDVSGYLDEDEANALVRETAESLFIKEKKLNKPFLLLLEECHEYLPQSGGLDETGEMLIRVAKRGRKRGLGLCGISQRPADVKKDFITQCDWLVWHRLTWENDTKVVRRVLGSGYDDEVQDLADGEAFLMADFLESDVQRVQVRRKRTFDAGATPDLGEFERPDLKSVGGDLVDELQEISEQEQQRQDRIAQLEDRVEELQDEKAELEEELESARDMRDMASQFAEAMQAGDNGDAASEKVDELVDERNRLRSELEDREDRVAELEDEVEELREELSERPDIGERTIEAVEVLAEEFDVADGDNEALRRKLKNARERIDELESDRSARVELDTDPLENRMVKRYLTGVEETLRGLSDTKRQMLRYYIVNGSGEASEAYKYAGNSPTSSRRTQYSKQMEKDDLLEQKGGETYAYALDENTRKQFSDHFNEEEVAEIVDRVEDLVDKHVVQEEATA